jgi:hypothetical protein
MNVVKPIIKYIKSRPKLYEHFNFTYHRQLYTLENTLKCILIVLKTGISWRDVTLLKMSNNMSYSAVYATFKKLVKMNVLKYTYIELLKKYFIKSPIKQKLMYRYTDTTTIPNKYGTDKTGRNIHYNRKKNTKLSITTDKFGIVYNANIYSGSMADSTIFADNCNNDLIQLPNIMHMNAYFLADSGYDVKSIRNYLSRIGLIPIIPQNKRNIKDAKKIIRLSKQDKIRYNNRIKIENINARLKANRRINNRYDKNSAMFMGFIYLALIKMIVKHV